MPQPVSRMMPMITVPDLSRLAPFYVDQLGFELITDQRSEDGERGIMMFSHQGGVIGFISGDLHLTSQTTHLVIAVEARNLDSTRQVLLQRDPPAAVGDIVREAWGAFFEVMGPFGIRIRYLQHQQHWAYA